MKNRLPSDGFDPLLEAIPQLEDAASVTGCAPGAGRHFWYLATPYTLYHWGIFRAAKHAARLAGALIARGVPVYSPIAHSHTIAQHAMIPFINTVRSSGPYSHITDGQAMWMEHCITMLPHACGMIIAQMDGWEDSIGIAIERDAFLAAGKPVVNLPKTLFEDILEGQSA